ncbi:MAG: hypothetical protein J6X37_03535 [Treponema sp.]|nr:hypothetical protein [Treponema sp.]
MKNRIICCLISIIAFSNFSFARTIDKPKTNEVIIVARIHFSTDADRKWYLDAFDVPEELREYPDTYCFPLCPSVVTTEETKKKTGADSYDIKEFEKTAWAVNGDYVFAKYTLGSNRTIYFSSATVFLNSSYNLPVKLPMGIQVKIPEDEKYVYIGDFYYSAKGAAFDVTVSVKDELADAQKALDKVTKEKCTLCRGSIDVIKEEKLIFYYAEGYTDLVKWYDRIKELLIKDE